MWVATLVATLWMTTFLTQDSFWGIHIGTALWITGVGETLPLFMVSVPEACALITIDLLGKKTRADPYANQIVYLTGLSFKFPWEQAKEGLYINLRILTQDYQEDFPAKDGPLLPVKGGFIYRPKLPLLPRYVAVDVSTINRGLVNITTSLLSQGIAKKTAAKARASIEEFQQELLAALEDESALKVLAAESQEARDLLAQGLKLTYETLFGIDFIAVQVSDIDYAKDYQDALTKRARARLIEQTVNSLRKDKQVADKDAVNATLLQFGLVKKDIFELEGNADEAIAAMFALWARGRDGNNQPQRN